MNTSAKKFLILLTSLGLMVMLGTVIYQRLANPELADHSHRTAGGPPAEAGQGMPGAMDSDSEIGRLMRMAGEQPDNAESLTELGLALLSQEKFSQAGVFLERARALEPDNPDILYYLGFIAHKLQDHEKAVSLMEASLRVRDRAQVHFSIANILRYFLNDNERALQQIKLGLAAPDCSEELRMQYAREVEKSLGQ